MERSKNGGGSIMKVERMTYANFVTFAPLQYERIHGIVTGYGGRVLDVKMRFNADNEVDLMYMFYEMPNSVKVELEKEIGNIK